MQGDRCYVDGPDMDAGNSLQRLRSICVGLLRLGRAVRPAGDEFGGLHRAETTPAGAAGGAARARARAASTAEDRVTARQGVSAVRSNRMLSICSVRLRKFRVTVKCSVSR